MTRAERMVLRDNGNNDGNDYYDYAVTVVQQRPTAERNERREKCRSVKVARAYGFEPASGTAPGVVLLHAFRRTPESRSILRGARRRARTVTRVSTARSHPPCSRRFRVAPTSQNPVRGGRGGTRSIPTALSPRSHDPYPQQDVPRVGPDLCTCLSLYAYAEHRLRRGVTSNGLV